MTVKSDDVEGRLATYKAIVEGTQLPQPSIPESFKVLIKELQGLGLDIRLLTKNNQEFNLSDLNNDMVETFANVTKGREKVDDLALEFEDDKNVEEDYESNEDFDGIFDESALFDDFDDSDMEE